MKLAIVESPTKAKTIAQFLKGNFKVIATYGHIRDLPKSKLGVDVENNFTPHYVIPKKARKIINLLKKTAQKAEEIYLATDPDREGEAIAYHLVETLNLKDKPYKRIIFHEITPLAINKALENPTDLNFNLVNAQQARRILDRLVGYELSPFLWKKVIRGLSAGRVQSPALRLIVERERERINFKTEKYFKIFGIFLNKEKKELEAELIKINDKTIEKPGLKDEKQIEEIKKELLKSNSKIIKIEKEIIKKNPSPPFTTSTLQQSAYQIFKFSAKKTMLLAQALYEGKKIGKEAVGLITYMRTDSTHLSPLALESAKKFLKENFGDKYILEKHRQFKSRSRLAQEAHEAIRPTDPYNTPEKVKPYLTPDEFKLYQLIWQRFLASQMPEAIFEKEIILIESQSENNYLFKKVFQQLIFDGFLKIYPYSQIKTEFFGNLTENESLNLKDVKITEHFTQPPPRYNDASLVKTLEKYGIGRPSTYAPIISILLERGYVLRDQNKAFYPTEIGFIVNDLLVNHFPEIIDYQFTSQMEENLDLIAQGEKNWQAVLKNFYFPFKEHLLKKEKEVKKGEIAPLIYLEEKCPLCQNKLVSRLGRYGRFITCEKWPQCPYKKNINQELPISCPLCQKGKVVIKKNKKGKIFYACSEWPNCNFLSSYPPLEEKCPLCGHYLIKTKKR
ncbi:MAG: type I DNA topoisomerase [Minisyncoccia bacterium]